MMDNAQKKGIKDASSCISKQEKEEPCNTYLNGSTFIADNEGKFWEMLLGKSRSFIT
jgi:hypothetical protein